MNDSQPDHAVDDWESHWSRYADLVSENPAQEFRRLLIIDRVGRGGAPKRVLDVGSGQGDLLVAIRDAWPDATLVGIELSTEGVRISSAKVPDARFICRDLTEDSTAAGDLAAWADVAVCSEVLEHVDDPAALLANAAQYVAPGGFLVVTVPGGPRTAFDRHIGHRRHYNASSLRAVLEAAGLDVEEIRSVGFPFFNLYKSLVLVRGGSLANDVASDTPPSKLARAVMRGFGFVLRPGLNLSRWGWQLVAVARPGVRPPSSSPRL